MAKIVESGELRAVVCPDCGKVLDYLAPVGNKWAIVENGNVTYRKQYRHCGLIIDFEAPLRQAVSDS